MRTIVGVGPLFGRGGNTALWFGYDAVQGVPARHRYRGPLFGDSSDSTMSLHWPQPFPSQSTTVTHRYDTLPPVPVLSFMMSIPRPLGKAANYRAREPHPTPKQRAAPCSGLRSMVFHPEHCCVTLLSFGPASSGRVDGYQSGGWMETQLRLHDKFLPSPERFC